MSGKSIVDQIKHYQKDIERCPDNSERMIRCIQRLYVLPIKVEHLQETGVGRSVNSLRKYKGEVGDAAKALVTKWKAMVAAEESSDEIHDISLKKHQDVKISSPQVNSVPQSPVKVEGKSDHHSSRDKNSVKNHSSNNKKHHSESKSRHSENKTLHSNNKPRDKTSDNKIHSSNKTSLSSSNSNNHTSTKKDNSVKNHKSHHDKKRKSESDESPPYKKPKKHHTHSRSHSSSSSRKKEIVKSESEDESSSSAESEISAVSDNSKESDNSRSEKESEVESENSNSDVESDSSSSTDHRHRSKHKSSHHKRESSSHSRERNDVKCKENKDKLKEKSKYKEHNNKSKSDKHSSKKSNSSDYKELIKENEKKIKKEKDKDNFLQPKSVPPTNKNIKIELNEDGSIDSGCGASFADALLGVDSLSEPKKKKKISSSTVSSSTSINKSSKSSSSSSKSSNSHTSGPVIKTEGSSSKSSKVSSSSSKPKTIDELVEPPELLTKKVKLEALDLDISSTLPEINPNYKPLPHIPENPRRQSKTISEEAMFSMMTNKNQRTKVFSGNKVYQSTVPSLFSLCIQLLYDNIDAVEYTGGVPYNLLKPLLEKLNADQLYILEHYNPYLIEDTDELWKFHCKKDFRGEQLQDMETWRELYLRCLEERERKLKALTANISQSMAKSTPVRQAKLAYVDAVVKPPRNVARKQAKYGTGNSTPSSKNPTKQEIVSKAIVGGNTPGVSAKDIVPTPPPVAKAASHHPTPAIIKKKKAPLMQKALQVMKGTRYKR